MVNQVFELCSEWHSSCQENSKPLCVVKYLKIFTKTVLKANPGPWVLKKGLLEQGFLEYTKIPK